ncbi:hypothetical protein [Nonomuraea candida]|uniref:hypothetical protein n=1 Tax=Nonomuraea candida TaxID=359159 RepID=UPI0012F89123|nr:hypothetical protein [Nonomuraea candida]
MPFVTDAGKAAVTRSHPPGALMRLVNPIVKALIRRGRGGVGDNLMLLHFTGRTSGRRFDEGTGRRRGQGRRT